LDFTNSALIFDYEFCIAEAIKHKNGIKYLGELYKEHAVNNWKNNLNIIRAKLDPLLDEFCKLNTSAISDSIKDPYLQLVAKIRHEPNIPGAFLVLHKDTYEPSVELFEEAKELYTKMATDTTKQCVVHIFQIEAYKLLAVDGNSSDPFLAFRQYNGYPTSKDENHNIYKTTTIKKII